MILKVVVLVTFQVWLASAFPSLQDAVAAAASGCGYQVRPVIKLINESDR